MVKKVKQPKQAREVPSLSKQPRIAVDPNSYYQKRPSWRVAKMEFVDPFGWHILDKNCSIVFRLVCRGENDRVTYTSISL